MNEKDDDILMEGAKRIKHFIQDKNIKPMDIINALEVSKETMSKWMQNSTSTNTQSVIELARLLGVTERLGLDANKLAKESSASHLTALDQIDLKNASVDQLIAELKARYAALNLKAEVQVSVQPLEGGFVTKG